MILPHGRIGPPQRWAFFYILCLLARTHALNKSAFLSVPSKLHKNINQPSIITGSLSGPQTKIQLSNAKSSVNYERTNSSSLVWAMIEQIQSAKKIASVARLTKHPRLLRELQFQIKENERVLGSSVVDSELPISALKKMEALKLVLSRAAVQHDRCEDMVKRLQSSVMVSEDKLSALREENKDLGRLAVQTVPKGFHCLALQLTIQYYNEGEVQISEEISQIDNNDLMHHVIYTENILAATAIVNSTVNSVKEPNRHVFHVLTDDLNFAAFRKWFQRNTPDKASVEIKNFENFHTLSLPSSFYDKSRKSRKISKLRAHVRQEEAIRMQKRSYLYHSLSEIFPKLLKILVLDDDVVVQKDLSHLWEEDLHQKVIGAVGSCETSGDLGTILGWACMNMVDLGEWRRQGLSNLLESDLDVWDALTALRQSMTHVIDESACQVLDLDGITLEKVNKTNIAAVVHYKGYTKPWLGVGMNRHHRDLWTRFVNYENPLLQACNIHK